MYLDSSVFIRNWLSMSPDGDDDHEFFDRLMSQCTCDPRCLFEGARAASQSFAALSVTDRIAAVRGMLLVVTSAPGTINEFTATPTSKKRKWHEDESSARCIVQYGYQGRRLCMKAFCAIVSLGERTVQRHARDVSSNVRVSSYETNRNMSRLGKPAAQSFLLCAFLQHYSGKHGLPDPRGNIKGSENIRRYLPASGTKKMVYEEYLKMWESISSAAIQEQLIRKIPESPLKLTQFKQSWLIHFPELVVAHRGSDFCDTCIRQQNLIRELSGQEKSAAEEELDIHRKHSNAEYNYYNRIRGRQLSRPRNGTVHMVFDFAEKVLLPSMERQPGSLHFVTGLKYDMFGISNSNEGTANVYGLPEGHWPGTKGPNSVISMLFQTIVDYQARTNNCNTMRLILHADNCAGQNKNRFVIWFCSLMVLMGKFEEVRLCFLISGHTKNVCAGAFGNIRKRFRSTPVNTPMDMNRLVDESSRSTRLVPPAALSWTNWKNLLEQIFTVPSSFKISASHVFIFKKTSPGMVTSKTFSTSAEFAASKIFKRGFSPETAVSEALICSCKR